MRCYYAARAEDDEEFFEALKEAALGCHGELMRRGQKDPDYRGMATTLTLYLGVWPCAYLLQVGDSRCYILEQGQLTQLTRDQTMAQELIDLGVMKRGGCQAQQAGAHALECNRRTQHRAGGHPTRRANGAPSRSSAAMGSPSTSRMTASASGCSP